MTKSIYTKASKAFMLALFLVGTASAMNFSILHAAPEVQIEAQTKMVNINQAAPEELQTLVGIGPAIAARIVEYRQEHGRFENAEDLVNVQGIGEVKLAKIKNQISV